MNKKLLGVLGITALLLAGNFAWQEVKEVDAASQPEKLYLTPNSNWKVDNARFAAYFFGNGETWVSMTDSDSDGIYEADVPDGYPNVIFCRMNPSASANNWNNKWNQTADLTIPTDGTNHYTIADGTWNSGGGTWSVYGEEVQPYMDLKTLVNQYLLMDSYIRDTEIYVDATAIATDLQANFPSKNYSSLFHNGATALSRKTYFDGNQLWMTNDAGTINSGYGTDSDGNMTHFKYENGIQIVDYTVSKPKDIDGTKWTSTENGMEGYYITLKDIIPSENHQWELEGNVYSSSDEEVKEWFKAFTAPCYTGFEDAPNYITFDHVEIEEIDSNLELRLYASGTCDGLIQNSDNDENTPTLFSKATISLPTKRALPGSFNSWNQNYVFHQTDVKGYLFIQMKLEAADYTFKYLDNGTWKSLDSGTVPNTTSGSGWKFKSDVQADTTLKAEGGTYVFKLNPSTSEIEVFVI